MVELVEIKKHLSQERDNQSKHNHIFYDTNTGLTNTRISATFKDYESQAQSTHNLLDNRQKIMITENEKTFQNGVPSQSHYNDLVPHERDTLNVTKLELCQGLIVSPIIMKQRDNINIKEAMIYMYEKYIGHHATNPISMSYQNEILIKRILFGTYEASEYSGIGAELVNPGTPRESVPNLIVENDNIMDSIKLRGTPNMEMSPLPSNHEMEIDCDYDYDHITIDEKTRIIDNVEDDYDDETLLSVFDNVAVELIFCLHDSFGRFQSSKSYVEFSKIQIPTIDDMTASNE